MAEPILILNSDDVVSGNYVHPQMIKDLRSVASIDDATVFLLKDVLEAEDGFLSEKKLEEIVSRFISNEGLATAVSNAIQNLRPNFIDQAITMIDAWRQSSQANKSKFSDTDFETLKTKLPILIEDYPALVRMRKASRLRSIIGNKLEKTEIICDARPVFDDEREMIEGMLSLATMKLHYETQENESKVIEVAITSKQLSDLQMKISKAQQKMEVLSNSFSNWVGDLDS